jgi:hypothetical protein
MRVGAFIDTDVVAGLYAALAGSTWANAADREQARRLTALFPADRRSPSGVSPRMLRAREFHSRAARQAARAGAAGIVFGAAGLPASPAPHEAALEAFPGTRFCYAGGEVTAKIAAAVYGGVPEVSACAAMLRDPGELMDRPEVRKLGDRISVQAQMAAHFWSDKLGRDLVSQYARLLSPGSTLVLTWALPAASRAGREWAAVVEDITGAAVYRHPPGAVARWIEDAGLELLWPGARGVRGWPRRWPELEWERAPAKVMGAVARKR